MKKMQNKVDQGLGLRNELISIKYLSKQEQELLSKDLRDALSRRRKQMSPKVKLELSLLQLGFQIKE